MYSYFSTGWKMSSCDFETSGLDQFFRTLDQILMTKPFDLNWWQQLGKSFRELFCNTGTLSYIKVHIDHVRAAPLEARATVFEMIWSVFKVKLEKRLSAKKVFNFFMQRNIFILLGCMTRFQAFTRLTTYRKKFLTKTTFFNILSKVQFLGIYRYVDRSEMSCAMAMEWQRQTKQRLPQAYLTTWRRKVLKICWLAFNVSWQPHKSS